MDTFCVTLDTTATANPNKKCSSRIRDSLRLSFAHPSLMSNLNETKTATAVNLEMRTLCSTTHPRSRGRLLHRNWRSRLWITFNNHFHQFPHICYQHNCESLNHLMNCSLCYSYSRLPDSKPSNCHRHHIHFQRPNQMMNCSL